MSITVAIFQKEKLILGNLLKVIKLVQTEEAGIGPGLSSHYVPCFLLLLPAWVLTLLARPILSLLLRVPSPRRYLLAPWCLRVTLFFSVPIGSIC